MSPPSDMQAILEGYDRIAKDDPDRFASLMKPNHTTKASLLHNALMNSAITDLEYLDYTFCVLVESLEAPPTANVFTYIIMCIDEGSRDNFTAELARLFGEDPGKAAVLNVEPSGEPAGYWDKWEHDAGVLLKAKAKGGAARIVVGFERNVVTEMAQ